MGGWGFGGGGGRDGQREVRKGGDVAKAVKQGRGRS